MKTKNNSTIADWEDIIERMIVHGDSWQGTYVVEAPKLAKEIAKLIAQALHRKDEEAKAQREELLDSFEELSEWLEHSPRCILSSWQAGRPTEDGGYESKYGGVWYQSKPVDNTPPCDCGLNQKLQQLQDKITALRSSEEMK